MATLTITETEDFRGDSLDNITRIVFQAPDGAQATFDQGQFGPGEISNEVEIVFGDSQDRLRVLLASGGASISAAG